jgi:pimeloyl-ACP methyl ester carboxylesterase
MSIPLRDDGSPGPDKHLIVFVHGFASNARCWDPLVAIVAADPRFARYELKRYEYSTTFLSLFPGRRIPSVQELGQGLAAFMAPFFGDAKGPQFVDITLVGHSQGGLVIQSYLVDELRARRGDRLVQVRQVLLFGTPNHGSTIAGPLRKLLFNIFANPQERLLRVLDPEWGKIRLDVQNRIVSAAQRTEHECPIPVYAFWGDRDGIVVETSARGPFGDGSPLSGDHFGIIRPQNTDDPLYVQIRSALLEPTGHPHIFEVDEFRFTIRPRPQSPKKPVPVSHGGRSRNVVTDNAAHVERAATFGSKNRCREPFTIKYATRNQGFIAAQMSHRNHAASDMQRKWEDEGTEVWFAFHPVPSTTYTLTMEVYKGFDVGHRDVHHHLGRKSFYRRYLCELDVTDYQKAGYELTVEPNLCFLPCDPTHSALCAERNKLHPEPVAYQKDGVWRWELDHLREGVVDVRWDFKKM